jgi:hypothetical protein
VFTCQPSMCNAQGGNGGAFEWQGKLFAQSMKAVFFPHGCCTAQLASSQARRRSESRAIFCRAAAKTYIHTLITHSDHTLVRDHTLRVTSWTRCTSIMKPRVYLGCRYN